MDRRKAGGRQTDDGEVDKKDKKRKKRAALFFRKTNNADKVSQTVKWIQLIKLYQFSYFFQKAGVSLIVNKKDKKDFRNLLLGSVGRFSFMYLIFIHTSNIFILPAFVDRKSKKNLF